ncbi:MAG TPA: hypothetical protein PK712_09905, partial [Rectinema sp.]|nr:hypothetical protein [Rectinema sp.]
MLRTNPTIITKSKPDENLPTHSLEHWELRFNNVCPGFSKFHAPAAEIHSGQKEHERSDAS